MGIVELPELLKLLVNDPNFLSIKLPPMPFAHDYALAISNPCVHQCLIANVDVVAV